MTLDAWFTALVVVILVAVLLSRRMGADVAFLCALAALLVGRVITPAEAVAGFANPAVITVGLLYVIAQGLKETGGMVTLTRRMLGRPKSLREAQFRLLPPVAAMSALVNNTPIVAMFLPTLSGWARRNRLQPSRLYMPLSFAAMLGGTCTLIGTSTNLVVNELMIEYSDLPREQAGMGMFTLAWVGVPVTIVGLAYILVTGRRLLPSREALTPIARDPREYTVWLRVHPNSPLVGKTIEEAGLRHLSGLFLAEIERHNERMFAVRPDSVLESEDRLRFVGVIESVVELQQIKGLVPDTEQIHKLAQPRRNRRLIEAVVSEASPLVGQSIRESGFRGRYDAVVIAVHRAGEAVRGKIGDIVLRPGDTLLLEAPQGFALQHRNSRAFYLVSELDAAVTLRWGLSWVAVGILLALVVSVTLGVLDIMTAAMTAAVLMVITRCCTGTQARQSIDWQVLLVIGAAFGLANAMGKSGLALRLTELVFDTMPEFGLPGLLASVYIITSLLTMLMTNNAAAALVFPIAYAAAVDQGAPMMSVAVCVAVGASAAFASPLGYQTNMMVMGPGGYSWGDFLRVGAPLTIITGIVTIVVASLVWG